jgi:hypothetical protein
MIGDQALYRSRECRVSADTLRSRGALSERRSLRVTCGGVQTSENADISNDKAGEIPVRRKPKVSWAMLFIPGLVGS